MLTHQLVADMKRDSTSMRLPLAVCASRNGGPQTYDCARSLSSSWLHHFHAAVFIEGCITSCTPTIHLSHHDEVVKGGRSQKAESLTES